MKNFSSKKAFDGLLQLLTLNLSKNAIETIPLDAFFGLVSLRKMDLSHNFIEKLDNKTNSIFEDCLSLQEVRIDEDLCNKSKRINIISFQLNLSYNKISFITRKMFPSNPWIPYRLERVDLSYNHIPVLTFDITFGTKKLKYLNISHNSINDIRKYVLGNITALEVLDMSNNQLSNLMDSEAPFILPENLTKLYLQDNNLFKIDFNQITKLKNIKEVNFENNELLYLNKTLIDAIKNGVSIRFAGNPLTCNCELRPLKHFLLGQPSPARQYLDLICSHPRHVSGTTLENVEDKQLTCTDAEKSNIEEFNHEYEVLPDIRFRDILL